MNTNYLIRKIGAAPPPLQKIVEDQDAFDIIKQIRVKHEKCAGDYDKIAADFEGGTVYDIAEKLWIFCKNNLKYHRETINKQFVSAPQTMLLRGYCDCKGYALFIGGVLDALNRLGYNIKWKYRFASDDIFNEIPGHVFIVVTDKGKEIWVDPVLSEFNQDYYFPYHVDKKVSVSGVTVLRGVGCCAIGYLDVIGALQTTQPGMIDAIQPPPPGSIVAFHIDGWPSDLPQLMRTPDNRIQFSFLPMSRVPTVNDLAYVMTGLQAIYNSYLSNPYNIFTFTSPGGRTFAAVLNRALQSFKYNKPAQVLGVGINNVNAWNLLTLSDSMRNDPVPAKDFLFDTIAPLFKYIGYLVPVAGEVEMLVVGASDAADKSAAAAAAAQKLQLTQQVAQTAGQAAGGSVDKSGNYIDPNSNKTKILLIAAAAIAAILLIK